MDQERRISGERNIVDFTGFNFWLVHLWHKSAQPSKQSPGTIIRFSFDDIDRAERFILCSDTEHF